MKLPITKYHLLLDQSLNLFAGYRQGEFSFLTTEDKQEKDKALVQAFKEFEKVKENLDGW